ncbi:MAG TPA: YiiD C-terminal domain-containing protein [Steroidobacteraceae bacterium]|jgi:thioesterase domain-containing protein|nr:YiiD C-terminal domain-containing protein [Steroidobacteraceae bacterium]
MSEERAAAVEARALRDYLRRRIPLAAAMDLDVLDAGAGSVLLSAPLAPNVNHRGTAFGGSVSALAILSAWSLLHVRLHDESIESRLVIQRNVMEYLQPIDGTFTARATLATAESWDPFVRLLRRRGKARIAVLASLEYGGAVAGRFEGEFVALT